MAIVAVFIAAVALKYNAKTFEYAAKSFENVRKTEELRVPEGIYRDISRGLKEYNLLEAESPSADAESPSADAESPKTEEEKVRLRKLDVLLDEFFADVNWLCFLILHDKIKDDTLVNTFTDQILDWYHLFEEHRPDKVLNMESYPDFQNFYLKYKDER